MSISVKVTVTVTDDGNGHVVEELHTLDNYSGSNTAFYAVATEVMLGNAKSDLMNRLGRLYTPAQGDMQPSSETQ